MDQFGNDLKKVLQAGLDAVATGLEKAQDAIEDFSKKGEPLYEQAKAAVTDTVNKAKKAYNEAAKPQVDELVNSLQKFSAEELARLRAALDQLSAKQPEAPKEDAPEAADAPEDKPESDDETKA